MPYEFECLWNGDRQILMGVANSPYLVVLKKCSLLENGLLLLDKYSLHMDEEFVVKVLA